MKKTIGSVVVLLALSGFGSTASAVPVDPEDIVTRNGLEYAWAAPCAPEAPSCGNVPLVMFDGWEIATAADFLAGFVSLADLYRAFVTPNGNICASDHFNSGFSHCDDENIDPNGGNIRLWNSPNVDDWASPTNNDEFSETFVVRRVPEPGTLLLLGSLGLFGLGTMRRKSSST